MVFEDEARKPLLAGVSKLARAVKSTLGPRVEMLFLIKGGVSPKVTKDGVTVAEDIELDDSFENLGAHWSKRLQARQMMLPVTAPRRRPFSLKQFSGKA